MEILALVWCRYGENMLPLCCYFVTPNFEVTQVTKIATQYD